METNRFPIIVWGKACSLSVLMMSLSDQMSLVFGVRYFSTGSFAACLVGALAMIFLLRLIKDPKIRFAGAILETVLSVAWIVLLLVLQALSVTGQQASGNLLAFNAFLGRFLTLLVNIRWNYQFSLNGVDETPRYVASSVFLAIALTLTCLVANPLFAQLVLIAALITSSVLGIIVSYVELVRAGSGGAHLPDTVGSEDARHPVSSESYGITRLLYFGSRALYGLVLGFLVFLSSLESPAGISSPDLAAVSVVAAFATCLACACGCLNRRGENAAVVTLPAVAALLIYVAFYPRSLTSPVHLFAMLAEIAWTTQNLFQLPAYRRICGLNPATFAYADYLAQIVPYYLLVWALSSGNLATSYLEATGVDQNAAGAVCVGALATFCIFAMVRHAVKYLPQTPPQRAHERPREEHEASLIEAAQGIEQLTPRERDVFVLLAAGYSRSYIGKVLCISPDTVKVHTRHIYAKLGVNSKDQLIRFAAAPGENQPPQT